MSMKYSGLDYVWIAQMMDGTEVHQFDENGENEVLFKEVRDKDIANFQLMNVKTKKREFAVNLLTGKILAFEKWIALGEGQEMLTDRKDLKYRLIYFREMTKVFGMSLGAALSTNIVYFIGWQANAPATGQNLKKMIGVTDSNNVMFG